MADVPINPPLPPLEDPRHEKEIFASEIAGVGFVHGNVVVTLANVRFGEAIEKETPRAHRVVAGRIVLTQVAANQLVQHIQRLAAQIEAAAKTAASQKPS
jgi:hypothetical protein